MRICLIVLGFLSLLSLSSTAGAQDASDLENLTKAEAEARETEARLKAERKSVEAEIAALKAELARDTEQTAAFERENTRLAHALSEAEAQLEDLQAELDQNRAQTQELIGALQRLQLAPSPAILSTPDDAVKTAQAATMIDLLSEKLQIRAQETIRLATSVSNARDATREQKAALDANADELERRQTRVRRLVAEKEVLQASIRSEEDQARAEAIRLASEAETLRELLEQISAIPETVVPRIKPDPIAPEAPRSLPPGTVRFAEAQGAVIRPVSGRMTQGFGRGAQGQTYSARPNGQVIAPYGGSVEFAGPFRTYGQVVIINLNDGYYLLVTGLGDIYVDTGETVGRGEPIGRMPQSNGRAPLYVELRRNGRPIDPEPWMGQRR
ncbi:MAG: peptidoglycan DD-metalloendopeptidase family protein [Pseudomonadota bacterium]